MKRGKSVTQKLNISNRTLYTIISVFIIIAAAFVVYAAAPKGVNPGHDYTSVYLGPITITGDAGKVGIGVASPAEKLDVSGNIRATAFFYSSDRTLKTNILALKGALEKVLKLQGVSFDWKATGEPSIGLIAQDVEKVYPEAVATDANGIKSIDYSKLVAVLIEAVKEQQAQIDALEKEVAELKAE
ncbi:MAG TPA: tail fiber domain-containing protein [Candidatus Pacearchaeota archaeon]|nr:tail fiber domain-containing protein [Candidatus Pacearchaeota archaeon]